MLISRGWRRGWSSSLLYLRANGIRTWVAARRVLLLTWVGVVARLLSRSCIQDGLPLHNRIYRTIYPLSLGSFESNLGIGKTASREDKVKKLNKKKKRENISIYIQCASRCTMVFPGEQDSSSAM